MESINRCCFSSSKHNYLLCVYCIVVNQISYWSVCMFMPPKPSDSKLIRLKDASYRLSHNQSITYIPVYCFLKAVVPNLLSLQPLKIKR